MGKLRGRGKAIRRGCVGVCRKGVGCCSLRGAAASSAHDEGNDETEANYDAGAQENPVKCVEGIVHLGA